MSDELTGCVLAILTADGVDGGQVGALRERLHRMGAKIHLASPGGAAVRGEGGDTLEVNADVAQIHARYYDALIVPGGPESARVLAELEAVRTLLRELMLLKRPCGAIAEGARVLSAAGLTGWQDGAAPEVTRNELVTIAGAARIEAFCTRFAREIAENQKRDRVDEASLESFPASDPGAGNAAI
jgi:catalase